MTSFRLFFQLRFESFFYIFHQMLNFFHSHSEIRSSLFPFLIREIPSVIRRKNQAFLFRSCLTLDFHDLDPKQSAVERTPIGKLKQSCGGDASLFSLWNRNRDSRFVYSYTVAKRERDPIQELARQGSRNMPNTCRAQRCRMITDRTRTS